MSKSGEMALADMESKGYPESRGDSIDPQEASYWNAYCEMKNILTHEAYMKYYGQGTFSEFCDCIDMINAANE